MDTKEKVDKIFLDKRLTNALERYEEKIKKRRDRLSRLIADAGESQRGLIKEREDEANTVYTESRKRIREIELERDKAIREIKDRYNPLIDAARNAGSDEIARLDEEIRELSRKPHNLIKKRMDKLLPIVQEDLKDSPIAKGATMLDNGRIQIDMKPIMVKRSGRDVFPTKGFIILSYDWKRQIVQTEAISSEGRRHPHGGCLNTNAYDFIRDCRFADAVYDLAMALAVTRH